MEKTVFFHMNQLGDLLFSLPLLAAARKEMPGARLCSVVRPPLAPLLSASGLVDEVVPKQGGIAAFAARVASLRRERFSRAVLFSESPESVCTACAAGIPERYGFRTASLRFLLTGVAARTGVPSLANNRALAELAGLTNLPADYAGLVKVPENETGKIREWLSQEGIDPGRLAIISSGASKRRRDKCWAEAHWVALVRRLQGENWQPVLTGAPSEKIELERLGRAIAPGTKTFAAPDGILSLAALMAQARVFVGIDSGAMHLAAALNVPVVAIFGRTDPSQIGPRPMERHTVLKNESIDRITPDDVLRAVSTRSESNDSRHP